MIGLAVGVVVVALAGTTICHNYKKTETSKILEVIDGYKGYNRVVSQEEYEFYQYFVERDLPNGTSEEELKTRTEAYIQKVNAVFYLGNELGLTDPYSFENLKLRLEQENTERQLKLEQGEVVYGLQQFSLETYFQYELENTETMIYQYLEGNMDDGLYEQAEAYYEENKEIFRSLEEITFEATVDGETSEVTADTEQLRLLDKSDMGLADFLNTAKVGDEYQDVMNYQERYIVVKDIVYSEDGFENNKQIAVYYYIREELYPSIIDTVIKNNPVTFEKN